MITCIWLCWLTFMCLCVFSFASIVVFATMLGVDAPLSGMQTPVEWVVIVLCCVVLACTWKLFPFDDGSTVFCMCVLLILRSVGCVFLCTEQSPLMSCKSLHARPAPLAVWHFVLFASKKVEHIIHRQGHTLSSRPPLLQPHNARCRAHSCQLVPVCLLVSLTVGSFTFRAPQSASVS